MQVVNDNVMSNGDILTAQLSDVTRASEAAVPALITLDSLDRGAPKQ